MNAPWQVHALDTVAPRPWRNGGGQTRELLRWPAQGDWQLRFSVADLDADGDFSPYPGVERWFTVLQGSGVSLQFADVIHTLTLASPPLRFDGGTPPHATLLDGPTRDVNLMLRGVTGSLTVVDAAAVTSPFALFTASQGTLTHRAQTTSIPAHSFVHFAAHKQVGVLPGEPTRFTGRGWWILANAEAPP